jgi:AraC-like DNA-binding protein
MRDPREVGGAWATFQRHAFADPSPALAPLVTRYWLATWDLRGQPPYRQVIVPFPNVQLSFRDGDEPLVRGVSRGYVVRTLSGKGRVFGVPFRAGCFRPFLDRPLWTITDRSLPASAVFGPAVPRLPGGDRDDPGDDLGDPGDDLGDLVACVEEFLLGRLPDPDPVTVQAAAIVDRIAASPASTRVEAVAAEAGMTVRRLQRLFAEYVGVPPKWVIRRYRLREVTDRLDAGGAVDWAGLAAELGYADQAHLTRDFTKMFGEPPTRYAQRY